MLHRCHDLRILMSAGRDTGTITVPEHSIRVHEIEVASCQATQQTRVLRSRHGVPSHVRQTLRGHAFHHSFEDPESCRVDAMLDTTLEEHLVPNTDTQQRTFGCQMLPHQIIPAHVLQAPHARVERADPGKDQRIGTGCVCSRAPENNRCPRRRDRAADRAQVPRSMVENQDRRHRAPLVEGITPVVRASGSMAVRSARATALNCASTM